jgi:transcriptional regulator with XRE-family HTH domain
VAYFRGKILYHLALEMKTLDEDATVGEKIRFYRMKRNMIGDTLAELVGLSRHAIIYYENNQTEPLLEDLKKIAVALDIDVDKLYDDYYRFLDYPYTKRIKQLRTEHGLLQRELGTMLGVTRRAVERWEHGKNKVTRDVWEKLIALNLL